MWRRLIYHPDINYALRQTLVLCLPVAVGLMLGELRFGLLFSLVPACCNIAGLDTPHKRFFKRLIIGASLFATCSLLTQLLLAKDVPLPFLLTGLTLVLGVTAELGPLHAKLLPASLLAAIFTLSLAGYMPVWEPLLIYALPWRSARKAAGPWQREITKRSFLIAHCKAAATSWLSGKPISAP